MQLSDRKWKEFLIRDVMKCSNCKPYHSSNLKFVDDKGVAYVTRTERNNGLSGLVDVNDDLYSINPANTISYGAETARFFYQNSPYITGNKMYYLYSDKMTRNIGLFFIVAIQNSLDGCFSYGNGAIPERVMRKSIMLPVTDTGEPDYQFMEDYIKELMLKKYFQYLI